MSPLSSSSSKLDLNTSHIAISSKRALQTPSQNQEGKELAITNNQNRREVPFTEDSQFVEVDGKKYSLQAPRGTYLDIMV